MDVIYTCAGIANLKNTFLALAADGDSTRDCIAPRNFWTKLMNLFQFERVTSEIWQIFIPAQFSGKNPFSSTIGLMIKAILAKKVAKLIT